MSQTVASHPLRDRMLGATRPGPEEMHERRAAEERQLLAKAQERREAAGAVDPARTQEAAGYRPDGRREGGRKPSMSLSA